MSHTILPQLHRFFEEYALNIYRQQVKHLLAMYAVPCIFMDEDQTRIISSVALLEGQLSQSLIQFRKAGIHQTRPSLWTARRTTPRGVLVQVKWDYLSEDGLPAFQSEYQYLLRQNSAGNWRIELVMAMEEKQAFRQWWQEREEGFLSRDRKSLT